METVMHLQIQNRDYLLDTRTSTVKFPNFIHLKSVSRDTESGFDPEPSNTPFPKFLPLSMPHAGSNARLSKVGKDAGASYNSKSFLKEDQILTSQHAYTASSSGAHKLVEPPASMSSYVLRHGQVTPPTFESLTATKALEAIEWMPRKRATSLQTHQLEPEAEAASNFSFLASPASSMGLHPITTEGHCTRKAAVQRGQRTTLPKDKKRKSSLEKNRIAAANCRIKRQRKESQLKMYSHEMLSVNKALRQTISDLTRDRQQLQSMLEIHLHSGSCHTPEEIGETLNKLSVDERFCQVGLHNNDEHEPTLGLHQDPLSLKPHCDQDIFMDDEYTQALLPFDSFSSAWESLLPGLDLKEDSEVP